MSVSFKCIVVNVSFKLVSGVGVEPFPPYLPKCEFDCDCDNIALRLRSNNHFHVTRSLEPFQQSQLLMRALTLRHHCRPLVFTIHCARDELHVLPIPLRRTHCQFFLIACLAPPLSVSTVLASKSNAVPKQPLPPAQRNPSPPSARFRLPSA